MKKFFLFFLITAFFILFSCASTPEIDDDEAEIPIEEYSEVITSDVEEPEQIIDDVITEFLFDDEEFIEQEEINNIEDIVEIAEIAEIIEIDIIEELYEEEQDSSREELTEEINDLKQLVTDLENRLAELEHLLAIMGQLLSNDIQRRSDPPSEPEITEVIEVQEIAEIEPEIAIQEIFTEPEVVVITETPAPVQAPTAQTPTTPTPAAQTQPVIQTPPVQTQPSSPPPVQQPEPVIPTEETAPVNDLFIPLNDFSPPAARIDSLTQTGMTPQDSEIIFSRIVRATAGQILEIPFRGNGWVYLGELASRRGIVYNSRRNDSEGQTFIFTLEEPGTYILKFYRQDFIRDFIINDHVQVIVGESQIPAAGWFNPSIDRGRVIAQPRWPSALEEAQILSGTYSAPSGTRPAAESSVPGSLGDNLNQSSQVTVPSQNPAQTQTANITQPVTPAQTPLPQAASTPQTSALQAAATQIPVPPVSDAPVQAASPAVQERLPPEQLMQRAREAFDRGNVASAITSLDQFMEQYPGGSDEVFWLYGQFYEANSPNRNILLSLDYYQRLVNEYPQSSRFEDARRRIAYLQRFYITIN